jgi:hypothetical protein
VEKYTPGGIQNGQELDLGADEPVTPEPVVIKLDPKVKKKWLEALRSGDYKQAQGVLGTVSKKTNEPIAYCCLGVLCDIFRRTKANVEKLKWEPQTVYDFAKNKDILTGKNMFAQYEDVPATTVAIWSGLYDEDNTDSNPRVIPIKPLWEKHSQKLKDAKIKLKGNNGDGLVDLGSLNDAGFSFKQIANLIEEYL